MFAATGFDRFFSTDVQVSTESPLVSESSFVTVCSVLGMLTFGRGVAGQGPRVVCERFLENKVHAAQSAAGREAPLRPAGGLGGAL